jgi:hypothetical protein
MVLSLVCERVLAVFSGSPSSLAAKTLSSYLRLNPVSSPVNQVVRGRFVVFALYCQRTEELTSPQRYARPSD